MSTGSPICCSSWRARWTIVRAHQKRNG